jgi:predicted dehydrogenase
MTDTPSPAVTPRSSPLRSGPLRLGMLGLWHVHAAGMVRQIALHPEEFQLVAGFDREESVCETRLREWRDLVPEFQIARSPEDLFSRNLDGVLVEGRVDENIAWASLAIERGLPVLLEKPAGTDVAGFAALQQRAFACGVHLQLAYLFRAMPAIRAMLRHARAGDLGTLYRFHARLPKEFSLYDEFERDLGHYPGGIFFEMAGHLIDFLIRVAGQPTHVQGFLRHHHPQAGGAFVDNAVAVIHCPGLLATIEATALEVLPGTRRIELFGTRGGIVIPHLGSGHLGNFPRQPYELFLAESSPGAGDGTQGRWRQFEPESVPLQIGDLREFSAVVRGEKAPEYSPAHDLAVQETLMSCCAPPAGTP